MYFDLGGKIGLSMRKLLALIPWMVVAAATSAQSAPPGTLQYSYHKPIQGVLVREGADALASKATLESLGWKVRFDEGEADIEAEGRRIRVNAHIGPDSKPWIPLESALEQLGAKGEWNSDGDTYTVLGVIRNIEVFAGRLRIDSTLAVSAIVAQIDNPNRWILDIKGSVLREKAKFSLPSGIRFGQYKPDVVRIVIESPDLDGLVGPYDEPARTMTLTMDGYSPPSNNSLTGPVVTPPKTQPITVKIVPLDPPKVDPDPASGADPDFLPTATLPPPTTKPSILGEPIRVGAPVVTRSDENSATISLPISGISPSRPAGSYRDPLTIDVLLFGVLGPEGEKTISKIGLLEGAELISDSGRGLRLTVRLKQPLGFELSSDAKNITLRLIKPKIANGKLAGKVIVVDAGHGGDDSGATSPDGKVQEKRMTLAIARQVSQKLTDEGAAVIMTRNDDTRVPLIERSAIANRSRADLFISVHINSNKLANTASGTMIFYHKQDPIGLLLAECISQEVSKVSGMPNKGTSSDTRIYSSGFSVLRNSNMPCVLMELGFINHSSDRNRMVQTEFHAAVATAVVRALKVFLGDGKTKTNP